MESYGVQAAALKQQSALNKTKTHFLSFHQLIYHGISSSVISHLLVILSSQQSFCALIETNRGHSFIVRVFQLKPKHLTRWLTTRKVKKNSLFSKYNTLLFKYPLLVN